MRCFTTLFIVFTVLICEQGTQALSTLLQEKKPYCFSFIAEAAFPLSVSYMVTGINEDQVSFTAKQNNKVLAEVENGREQEIEIKPLKNGLIDLCWEKLDRKSKKLNFLVTSKQVTLENQVGSDTIEEVEQQLGDITRKLDQMSMNINVQKEVE
mmetsp:Transcript_6518/g.4646  ORF Transcript_6518/g.4646 Transcript_6518/m.4646 type:complete len:154 (+) Transcript_6518:20-481(+)